MFYLPDIREIRSGLGLEYDLLIQLNTLQNETT